MRIFQKLKAYVWKMESFKSRYLEVLQVALVKNDDRKIMLWKKYQTYLSFSRHYLLFFSVLFSNKKWHTWQLYYNIFPKNSKLKVLLPLNLTIYNRPKFTKSIIVPIMTQEWNRFYFRLRSLSWMTELTEVEQPMDLFVTHMHKTMGRLNIEMATLLGAF